MLHTVNKSPFENSALESCLRLARKGSAILLIEDAVYAAFEGTAVSDALGAATADHAVYVLGPDVAARGMGDAAIIAGIETVDYGGFVDLTVAHDTVQAWL